jgi:hypothetical protein
MKPDNKSATAHKTVYASVAAVRQTSSGKWQVTPPLPTRTEPQYFESKQDAIEWIVTQGWGVHLR